MNPTEQKRITAGPASSTHPAPQPATQDGDFPVMRQLHLPLIERYRATPDAAMITDHARTTGYFDPRDPMRGHVSMGPTQQGAMSIALHSAIGGDSALPVPGDLLCAALATCVDSTTRVVANRLDLRLSALSVEVEADVDVRGTLMVDPEVPVAFQHFRVEVRLRAAAGSDPRRLDILTRAAEHSCVVLQTLRCGVEVELSYDAAIDA